MANPFAVKNEKPYEHRSRWGTEFSATRCDLKEGVVVKLPGKLPQTEKEIEELVKDLAEMIGFHEKNILGELEGRDLFGGYDTVRFKIEYKK